MSPRAHVPAGITELKQTGVIQFSVISNEYQDGVPDLPRNASTRNANRAVGRYRRRKQFIPQCGILDFDQRRPFVEEMIVCLSVMLRSARHDDLGGGK